MPYATDSCIEPSGPFTADPTRPCVPGDIDTPICYTIPPGQAVYNGFKRITLLADCTASNTQILDENLVPVPGAEEVGCNPLDPVGCCDPVSLCTIFQTLPTQVPAPGDTALFVTLGGCFLGVPGGGGGGFPGYGIPITVTGPLNAGGASALVARADHQHRLELEVELGGIFNGARPTINFISPAGNVIPTVTVADNGGADRVDITIDAQQQLAIQHLGGPAVATNPSFINFTGGITPIALGTGVDVTVDYAVATTSVSAAAGVIGISQNVARQDHTHHVLTGVPVDIGSANAAGVSNNLARADHVHRGVRSVNGLFGDVTVTASGIGANQTIDVQDDGASIIVDPDTLNFRDSFIVTALLGAARINLDFGSPVATAQTNAAGVSNQVARADHVHRTIVQVEDGGALIGSRPTINFIDGSGVSITTVDNGGNDRVDVTIASTSGVTGFATPTVAADAAAATGGVATTAIRSDAKLQVATGTPVATAQANAAGVASTLARSDHVHRTIVQFLDAAVLVSSRPSVNFIDGAGISVTVADDAGNDRADITIASTTGMTGFATPTVAADAAAATGGAATTAIRSDAKLQVATGTPVTATGTTNSAGVASTLARSDHVHRLGLEVLDTAVLVGTRPRINFIDGANVTVTVADDAGNDRVNITIASSGGGGAFIQRFTFQADQMETPNNANWAVNALAPAAADGLNNALTVRRFDDTIEEGVGGLFTIPTGAVNVTFYFKSRAQTAPGATAGVQPTLYNREIPDNAAVGAWSAALNLTVISIPTNTNFQYDSQTLTIASFGWAAGELVQIELTRRGTQAGDTLTGDWNLAEMIVEFTT